MTDDEVTQPAIPLEMARQLTNRQRSPSQDLQITKRFAFEAMEAIYQSGAGQMARKAKVEQWIGEAYDTARRELSEEIARLKEANAILEREADRLRGVVLDKDPRRER